jgi:predicted AlkP superfamily phosphohydrolase/phosphomutase
MVDRRDLARLYRRLTDDLLDVVNVETGEPVIDAVIPTTDLYDRDADLDDNLPDLIVLWNTRSPVRTVWSPKTGVVHQPFAGWRTGDHRADGLFMASAPWLAADTELAPVEMVDLAPTLAAMLGVQLDDVDGRPVDELLPSAVTAARAIPR